MGLVLTLYGTWLQGFADSELDSEISSLFSYGREVPNLHLMSPLEYAAMLKQVNILLQYFQLYEEEHMF